MYEFARGLDYDAIVATSAKVAWTVAAVVDWQFDASKAIVPAAWVGVDDLTFLDGEQRRVLNQCRAFSYVHLLGNYEDFIPHHLDGGFRRARGDDRARLRALLRFEEEELKHQELFRAVETLLEQACGYSFDGYFDEQGTRLTAFTDAVLAYPALTRSLTLLALELGTQRVYVESMHDAGTGGRTSLYSRVLRAHWVEEAQHTKCGMLEIAALASASDAGARRAAVEQVAAIGAVVDATIAGQASAEIATLQRVTGCSFTADQEARLHPTLHRSLAALVAGVALAHPRFAAVAAELSKEGAASLGLG
jgi:hypothetical protein